MKTAIIFIIATVLLITTPVTVAATPELFAAIKAGECGTVHFLIHLDPKMLEARSVRGIRPLHCAAVEGDVLIVDILLDEGADINAQCFDGTTPLMKAVGAGQPNVLIELDVPWLDVNLRDKKGRAALHYAAECGCCETIEFLLQRGADVNAQCNRGTTPLMIAAKTGQPELLDKLDVPCLGINTMDKKGWSALHYAARYGCFEAVDFLLRKDANVNARTNEGTTPLSLAIVNNDIEAGHLIQAYGGLE